MYKGQTVAVVIPCYRVEQTIAEVVSSVPAFVDSIIAVNDASPDSTLQILESLQEPRLTVLSHSKNQGVGGAMVTGFRKAIELQSQVVVKMDGDGQMKADFAHCLIDPIAEGVCDYCKGNRFLHSRELGQMPFPRLVGNIILTFLTKLASGYWHVFDPQNGYLAIRADYLPLLNLDRLATRRYFFENEMLIQLNIESALVLDIPMPSVYAGEVSSLRISRIITYFPYFLTRGFLSRLFHRYVMRDFSIVIPLYLLGAILVVWGIAFGVNGWIKSMQTGVPATTGTVMLAVLPLILGVQMLLQGLLFEILQTPKPPPRRTSGACATPE